MAKKVFNMEGGLHSANAFTAFEARAYGSCVASPTSLKVVPAGGMTVRVSVGDGIIDGQTPRRIQIDAVENITLTPASTSYARKDLIVAYIDSSVSPTTSVVDNANNILKFVAVNGTPSAVPATPSDSEIQAKIGAGNQYMILAEISVARSASSIGDSAILDRRNVITVVPVESLSGKITGSQIASSTIGADNINFETQKTLIQQALSIGTDSDFNTGELVQVGYGMGARFHKIGRMVYFNLNAIANASNGTIVEKIPEKYRPKFPVRFVGCAINSNNSVGALTYSFIPDGTIIKSGQTGYNEYICDGVYLSAN